MTVPPIPPPASLAADPSLVSYARSGGARKYRSTAGSQAAVDASQLDALSAVLERDGFVVLPDLVDADTRATMRAEIGRLLAERPGDATASRG